MAVNLISRYFNSHVTCSSTFVKPNCQRITITIYVLMNKVHCPSISVEIAFSNGAKRSLFLKTGEIALRYFWYITSLRPAP